MRCRWPDKSLEQTELVEIESERGTDHSLHQTAALAKLPAPNEGVTTPPAQPLVLVVLLRALVAFLQLLLQACLNDSPLYNKAKTGEKCPAVLGAQEKTVPWHRLQAL